MAAAYALALQALLGSFALAQAPSVAAAGLGVVSVLCAGGDSSHAPDRPAHALICDHCAVCSTFQSADLPIAQSVPAQVIIVAVIFSASRTADPSLTRKTPRLSQGPPSIA